MKRHVIAGEVCGLGVEVDGEAAKIKDQSLFFPSFSHFSFGPDIVIKRNLSI